jgi:hypothetical protein
MKYIVTEEQLKSTIKKLNKDNLDSGKLGKSIEKFVLDYLSDKRICDIAVITTNERSYTVIILTPDWLGYKIEQTLEKYIEDYFGNMAFVLIRESEDCEIMDR